MDIFNYASNGEYTGQSKADPDPVDIGKWLIPANATTKAPPAVSQGKTAVFVGGAWTLAEDHRGQTGWVGGKPKTIDALGPLPAGWSDMPPPIPLDMAIAAKCAEINAEKDSRIDAGVLFGGVLYDSDDKAQTRMNGKGMEILIAQISGQIPPPVEWIAQDNSRQTLAPSDFIGLGYAVAGHLAACVMVANAHKAAIAAMTDADAVQAYDYSTGWPE